MTNTEIKPAIATLSQSLAELEPLVNRYMN